MTTPRNLETLKAAAERAGEKLYEHRRRAIEAAAKARSELASQPSVPAPETPAPVAAAGQ